MSGNLARRPAPAREGPAVAVAGGDPALQEGLCALLESFGFAPRPPESAPPPACAVLSLDCLGLQPGEAARRVRALAEGGAGVVVVASCPDDATVAELLRAGAADVLEMPFLPETLIERVGAVLSRPPSGP
jgi:DNA-binding response OmpR family regulator